MTATNDDLLYKIIDTKVIDYAELVVCLFDHCNLRCVFCPQDHELLEGASEKEILSKVPGIVDWINNNQRSTYFKVHVMGGELFQDQFIQDGFLNYYQKFVDAINAQITDTDKHVTFNFITNLVFDNTQPVLDFIEHNDFKISVSYDTKGRFAQGQFDVFKDNIELFKHRIEMISSVMTRQTMIAITEGDEYYDYLYNNFKCDWDSFLPSVEKSQFLMPKESESLAFYKKLVKDYPKCINIRPFVDDTTQNKMSCTRGNSYTVLYDNTNPAGCSGSALLRDSKTEVEDLGSTKIVNNFMEKYNCFSCEFFQRCPFTCFIKQDYKFLVDDEAQCVFKSTFEYSRDLQR
jgi:hypothetical protein